MLRAYVFEFIIYKKFAQVNAELLIWNSSLTVLCKSVIFSFGYRLVDMQFPNWEDKIWKTKNAFP